MVPDGCTKASFLLHSHRCFHPGGLLPQLFTHINKNQDSYVKRQAEWVTIQSVSAWPEKRGEIKMMMEVAERLGGSAELVNIRTQKLSDGSEIPLPPIILGKLGSDTGKKTVSVYGHLDVQPAALEDGWDSESFVLEERDGKFYGRGSTDDKSPVLAWLNCIEAYQQAKQELPVNLKFCFEGMEEFRFDGLDDLTIKKKDTFFKAVDFVCISDNTGSGRISHASPMDCTASATFLLRWYAATKMFTKGYIKDLSVKP